MSESTAQGGRRRGGLRADARRSIERIVAAADRLTAIHGADVTLEEVAKEAGVAPATLYRHFPSKMHLLEDVYRGRMDALVARAGVLAHEHAPLDALVLWMREYVDLAVESVNLLASLVGQGLRESDAESNRRQGLGQLSAAAGGLLAAAQRAGSIKHDISVDEFVLLVSGVSHALALVPSTTDAPPAPEVRDRMLAIIIDGIRVHTAADAPVLS